MKYSLLYKGNKKKNKGTQQRDGDLKKKGE